MMTRGRLAPGPMGRLTLTVRSDLVAAARQRAAADDQSLPMVVARALTTYLAVPAAPPVMTTHRRERFPVRLPVEVLAALAARAVELGVSERLLLEAALTRAFVAPARGPSWDPNRSGPE